MALKDIRELRDDKEAYAAELERRWTGLLSYRYIGRRYDSMDLGAEGDNTVVVRHDFRNSTGGLMVAPIAISSPEGGGRSDLEAVPNPVIHSAYLLDPGHDVRRIEVRSETLKLGRQMGFSRSRIVDADKPERVIAFTEGQGISIGEVPEGLAKMPEQPIEVVDSPDLPPLWEVFGATRRSDGHWVLPELAVELASPDAALHIGPQHVVLETAAMDFAAKLIGSDRIQLRAWHVMFLSRGKTGPFRVDGEAVRGADGQVGVQLLLVDEGAGRAVTSGSAMFSIVD
jgi:acyl-coenzyme A thioesterase PaaI-like protein